MPWYLETDMETCFASSFLLNGRRFKTIRNQIILILKLTPQILRGETWFAASLLLNGMRSKTSRNQIILILKLTPKILRGETCFAYSFLLNATGSVVLVGFILNCWIEHVSCGLRLQLTGSYWESSDLALSARRHNKLPVRRSLGGSKESF